MFQVSVGYGCKTRSVVREGSLGGPPDAQPQAQKVRSANRQTRNVGLRYPYCFGGLIIICAPCVPGCMIQGIAGPVGFSGRPVLSAVAYGI